MKSSANFVQGGGWVKHQFIGKPKARCFGFLSLIWLGISGGALIALMEGGSEPLEYLKWVCVALPVPLPVFIILAIVFWRTEKPRTITELHPNPDHDIRKMY